MVILRWKNNNILKLYIKIVFILKKLN